MVYSKGNEIKSNLIDHFDIFKIIHDFGDRVHGISKFKIGKKIEFDDKYKSKYLLGEINVFKKLHELEEQGFIEEHRNNRYRLTEKGRRALGQRLASLKKIR